MRISTEANSNSAIELQETVTKNVRMLIAERAVSQADLADALGIAQSGLSRKVGRKTDWTASDIANLANFFKLSFAEIVTPMALFSVQASNDYHLAHNVQGDNSRRELAAPTGARYLRQPDDGNGLQGQAGPRAFMRVEDDFFGAKQVSGSAASRRRMLSAPCGTRTRKPMAMDFKSTASTNSAKGATVPC